MDHNQVLLFQTRLKEAGGWVEKLPSFNNICAHIRDRYTFEKHSIIFSGRVVERLPVNDLPGVNLADIQPDKRREVLANAALGITLCDGLLPDTGTIILLNHPSETRELSLLPERHIAIATPDQFYSSLDAFLLQFQKSYFTNRFPSMTLITGPSRTADIEKTLVIGVHGPREFGVILVG